MLYAPTPTGQNASACGRIRPGSQRLDEATAHCTDLARKIDDGEKLCGELRAELAQLEQSRGSLEQGLHGRDEEARARRIEAYGQQAMRRIVHAAIALWGRLHDRVWPSTAAKPTTRATEVAAGNPVRAQQLPAAVTLACSAEADRLTERRMEPSESTYEVHIRIRAGGWLCGCCRASRPNL